MSVRYACVAALASLALIAGCGDDDGSSETAGTASGVDGAFLVEMTAHHESAIAMARLAQEQAEHREVRELANAIVATQGAEIQQMGAMHERLFGEPLNGADHGGLGMADHEMGMDMDPMALDGAEPFDREFIDAMIEHHEGAIRMANVVLAEGDDPEVRDLAKLIVAAQSNEIDRMSEWRRRWYGSAAAAAGMSDGSGSKPDQDEMGH